MDVKVLTINSELKSAQMLGFPTSEYLRGSVDSFNNSVIIRWGNSSLSIKNSARVENNKYIPSTFQEFKNVINSSEAICLNCDKDKSLEILSKVVKTPKIFKDKVPKGKLVVYRGKEHSSGKGFNVQKGPFKIESNRYYATEYIRTDKEFRVFFCNNRTLMCRRVTKSEKRRKEKFPCRSLWNYSFYKKVPKSLHKDVLIAAKSIGLDAGAADILYKNGKYYFLELNSAVTLDNPKIIQFFKRNLNNLMKKKFKYLKQKKNMVQKIANIIFSPLHF